jgi:hypothetical protein
VHQQRLEVLAVVGIDGDADAGVHEDLLPGHANRMRQAAQNAPGELARVLWPAEAGHDDRELVAAKAGHVGRQRLLGGADLVLPVATRGAETECHLLEELIACLVAQRVVDPAEVVEVDEERSHQLPGALGLLQRLGQPLLVGEPVG